MNKEELKNKANETIEKFDSQISNLQSKKEEVSNNIKHEVDRKIIDLKSKRDELSIKMEGAFEVTSEALENVRNQFADLVEDASSMFKTPTK